MADRRLHTNHALFAARYPKIPPSNEWGRPLGGPLSSLWHVVSLIPAVLGLVFCAVDIHWGPIWVDEMTGLPDDGEERDGPQTLERVCSNPLCRFRLERSVYLQGPHGRAGV